MFGRKQKVHREDAAKLFVEHCRAEGAKLCEDIIQHLRHYCDGYHHRLHFDAIASHPLLSYKNGRFEPAARSLLAAHCYAIATATGLAAIRGNIDPGSQCDVMIWQAHKLIVEEDVGAENAGSSPSPWRTPGVRVHYPPGTFTGGVASQQQALINRYEPLRSVAERLVVFLLSLGVIRPRHGISKVLFHETQLGNGIVGRNRVGLMDVDPDQINEWEPDLQITDASAALAELPGATLKLLLRAIQNIDPFWPRFGRHRRLVW
jgi:hypothetical protein